MKKPGETAAAKEIEEISKEDVEIRRLIEERRNTPKEEKQRLKEVSKCIKKCVRDRKRMKIQQDIQRILEDFRGVKNIPRIKSAKQRVLITKIKNEKGVNHHISKRDCQCLWRIPQKIYDDNEQEESGQDIGENENENSIDVHNNNTNEMTRIPEITTEELRTAINKLKKSQYPDGNGILAEDIKACDDETREMVRQIFNEIIKQIEFTPEAWKKVKIKVIYKKRRCGKCWKLPPDLLIASVVQTVHDNTVRISSVSTTRPKTNGRSGGIQKLIPDSRSSCDVQHD